MKIINLKRINEYYTKKASRFGASPSGADWNGEASQRLRFEILSEIIDRKKFSLDDYGCGYGAYFDYLKEKNFKVDYLGIDISKKMVNLGSFRHPTIKFLKATESPRVADYAIASGIFNVALNHDRKKWSEYIKATLNQINKSVKIGFAFNCLSTFSEKKLRKPHLFYCDPCEIFKYCKINLSKKIGLLHDYELYEFTIIVRKD